MRTFSRVLIAAVMIAGSEFSTPAFAQRPQPATVAPSRATCLTSEYSENRRGYYSTPRVLFTNRCDRVVTAFICVVTVFQSGGTECAPNMATYGKRRVEARETFTVGVSSGTGARQLVRILECPPGYNGGRNGVVSEPSTNHFRCQLG